MAGWLDTDNRAISVQLNLTGTATGTELGKRKNERQRLGLFTIRLCHVLKYQAKEIFL